MILKNEKPLSSLLERTKTEHLKIEYSPIRILYCEDKYIMKRAYKTRPIFRIKGSKSGFPLFGFKEINLNSSCG
jgi:hypothetical protein